VGEPRLDVDVDPAKVAAAVTALQGLSQTEQTSLMAGIVEAVVAYRQTGDIRVLEQLAGDIEATVRLRQLPDYASAATRGASQSAGVPGRSVREIFAIART
jgi:hypothetical protein